ncbi:MAG: ASCH domain-containing protein [Candidatus Schekmanbacteria bacterium]|nr:MAG: ASCH domain-containing protein [Candidatus Schekmanbacteria bacterium]
MSRKFFLNLRERPFEAIKNGTKKVEIRANKNKYTRNSANLMKPGDIIVFTKENSKEKLECTIERITLYKTLRELLIKEGTEQTLSSTNDIEEGIKSIESIDNYKEYIKKNGVFAIKLKNVKFIN